jgi:hypothetical protein
VSRRLVLELAVVAGVGAFAYARIAPRWNGFFSPLKPALTEEAAAGAASAPEPGEKPGGPAPALSAPQARVSRPRGPGEAMLIVPEGTKEASEGFEGSGEPPRLRKTAPKVFERAPIEKDSPALAKPAAAPDSGLPGWLLRLQALDPRAVIGAVVGVFLLLYFLGVAALRRGPGGKGFTHD